MDVIRTVRDIYVGLLIELNKQEAPSILLEDFNFKLNEAINNYVHKRLAIYPIGQQVKDDLASLKVPTFKLGIVSPKVDSHPRLFTVALPENYLHLQGCSVEINVTLLDPSCPTRPYNKYPTTTPIESDPRTELVNNYYLLPSAKRVYYMVYLVSNDGVTYNMDLYCGEDTSVDVVSVYIDYVRQPALVSLTQEQLYNDEDLSTILEFTPYVNLEILKELVSLMLEHTSDARLNTFGLVSLSIAPPLIPQLK